MGALAGGVLASLGGLRLPWLLFGAGMLVISQVTARRLTNDAVDEAVGAAGIAKPAEDGTLTVPAPRLTRTSACGSTDFTARVTACTQ